MVFRTRSLLFSGPLVSRILGSDKPAREWHQVRYLEGAGTNRQFMLALGMVVWIAALDFLIRLTNFSVLYVVPMILVADALPAHRAWRVVAGLAALTYGVFVLKNWFNPAETHQALWDYRLFNRTVVVLMLAAMTKVVLVWKQWHEDQADEELSDFVRRQDQQLSATFALLCCLPLVTAIALLDFFSPANFNQALFYPVPLFICGWTGSRKLLWCMLLVMLALTLAGFWAGPPSTVDNVEASLQRNRFLAVTGMIAVTVILDIWLRRQKPNPV